MMTVTVFEKEMQTAASQFFEICFASVGIPYSPDNRHYDTADIAGQYMQSGCFWCAWEKDALVGTVALRLIDEDNKTAELKRLFVHPEYQRRGIGRALLEHAAEYARSRGWRKIQLDTLKKYEAARCLYLSFGFRETDRYNDNEHAELFFELEL